MLVIGFIEYHNLRIHKSEMLDDDMRRASLFTEMTKNSLTASIAEKDHKNFKRFLEPLVSSEILKIRLLGLDGTVIGSSDDSELGTIVPINESTVQNTDRGSAFRVNIPIYNERPCLQCHWGQTDVVAILSVDSSIGKVLENFDKVERNSLISFAAALVALSVLLGAMTVLLVTRPVKGIIRTMQRARDGDLKVRYLTSRTDEIGSLAENLNAMLFELDKTREELLKCHESDMQKAEKMATVGELAAAIAHDIKNPLAGISGAIQVFAEDFPKDDPRRNIIDEILREIARLDRSVKDLLSYARPPEPHFVKASIMPIIERVVRLVSGQCRQQGIEIDVEPSNDAIDIDVDPEQIQQVFLNIILNSVQSMSEGGGKIKIRTSINSETGMAEVSFRDTGPGIPEPIIKNIFKPFFTTKHTGTGLGLAISKNTVEKHGGTILVDSRLGVGTVFRVLFPLEMKHGRG